ncbi:PorP/SprF family type IX secretion system membrane protein [Flavobacteriaceae bacterium]|nr:PorP/SprF family type IX secretion system membrane protein [Flavobacteriaceae bacterium]MDC6478818.1 PorP/SprF family type IX secretion system membrane protein [Flavobacteriaceae bacterium]
MNKTLLILVLFLAAFYDLKAQQEPLLSAFHTQMNLVNPAFAGHKQGSEIGITSRNQWVSIENAPRRQFLTFSSERKNNIGLGISVISNKFFVEKSTSFAVDFSYKLSLANDAKILLGIKAGSDFYTLDTGNLTNFSDDPGIENFSSFKPNLGVGVSYFSENLWMSISVPKLFSDREDDSYLLLPSSNINLYLALGGKLDISDNITLKSNFIYKSNKIDNVGILNALVGINAIDFGAVYKTSNNFGLLAFFKIKNFNIGYCYEVPSSIQSTNLGVKTHEITLRMSIGNGGQPIEVEKTEEE